MVRANPATEQASHPFELVHLARFRNFGRLSLENKNFIEHHVPLEKILDEIKVRTDATNFEFLTAEEFQRLASGDTTLRQVKTLPQIEFKLVNMTDIVFENGGFRTVELALKR